MNIEFKEPSKEALATLTALKRAVENALERKRRLGQYAVVWRDGKPALLDEDVEDRVAFYEAMKKEPSDKPVFGNASNPKSGVADKRGGYRSDND